MPDKMPGTEPGYPDELIAIPRLKAGVVKI